MSQDTKVSMDQKEIDQIEAKRRGISYKEVRQERRAAAAAATTKNKKRSSSTTTSTNSHHHQNEIDQLENRFRRIIEEMKINEHNRPTKKSSSTEPQHQQQQQQQQVQSSPTVITNERNNVLDTSNDEGPVYDGSGGMGQPRGTVNTYAIEGMEEMTSEEYIKALQNKVIETQRERRESGRIGSHGTWNYLNQLSGNTAGILNKPK